MKKIVLLLTATVNPRGMIYLKRNNPIDRQNDYINALKLWLKEKDLKIVFCENSGYDLTKIKESCNGFDNRIEFLQFDDLGIACERGKGYGELEILEYSLTNSIFLKSCDYIMKVTGRYYIANAHCFLKYIVNSRDDFFVMNDLKRNLTFSDSRLFICKPEFIKEYLLIYWNHVNDLNEFYFEHALACATLSVISNRLVWRPLPYYPIIEGFYGTKNALYRNSKLSSFKNEVLHQLKNFLNEKS